MEIPQQRALNSALSAEIGAEVVLLEVVPVVVGSKVELTFESIDAEWRQGVWIGTEGVITANDLEGPQFVFWQDTAPELVELNVVRTDGLLRFYNVWDSGRGYGPFESQRATSGMMVEAIDENSARYRCNDIGHHPGFTKLTFVLAVTTPR